MSEPIEQYLDELYACLPADPRRARRLLDEAADHLYATADSLQADGLDRVDAEREAVRRFGPGAELARADDGRSFRRLLLETAAAVTFLGAVGLIAVGLSGLLAAAMTALFGTDFVGGGLAGSLFGGPPATGTEDAGDAVSLRVLAGLAGVVLLAAVWAVRRTGLRLRVLPASYVDLVALVAFTGATVALAAASIDQVVQHAGRGTGFFLSGAIVSLVGAALFGLRSVRTVLHRAS